MAADARVVLNLARLGFAATAIAAMAYQFAESAETDFLKANFFSFFTIQSNILAVVALFGLVVVPRERRTSLFDGARTAAVLYMAITSVVFALLLSGLQEDLQTSASWVDFVLHKLMPVVLVADWLVDSPRHRLPWWTVLAWLAYPLAWFAYTLARGADVDWYPYPFVDVSEHGYGGVLARAGALAACFAAAGAVLLWAANRRALR
jgi:hypothetical protein